MIGIVAMVGPSALFVAALRALATRRSAPDVVHLIATIIGGCATAVAVWPGVGDLDHTAPGALAGGGMLVALATLTGGLLWEVAPLMPAASRARGLLDSLLAVALITATFWNVLLLLSAQPSSVAAQAATATLLLLLLAPTATAAAGIVNDPTDRRLKRLAVGCGVGVVAGVVWMVGSAAGFSSIPAVTLATLGAVLLAVGLGTTSSGTRPAIDVLERLTRRNRVVVGLFAMYVASLLVTMSVTRDHVVMGTLTVVVLTLASGIQGASSRENLRLHRTLVAQVNDLARSEDRFRVLASTDELTGLMNRRSFVERLDHHLTRGRAVAVLFMDLDRFKEINDTLGHEAGDDLLARLGPRIVSALGPAVDIARFGGDEFCVLVRDIAGVGAAVRSGERVLEALAEPVAVSGIETFVAASIGVAVSDASSTSAQLLSDADAAMYEAKRQGRHRVAVFDHRLRERSTERLRIANELPRAIQGELCVHYQPVVAMRDGSVTGFEALVRWEHPTRGLIPPGAFIEVAEDTGLIIPLGAHVLETACRQLGEWIRHGEVAPDTTISVNLSPRQLGDGGLAAHIADALVTSGLDASNLVLELTESALMSEGSDIDAVVNDLHASGVRFSVDDFGTGYSSLTYLKRFPIDVLKVDRTFVDGTPDDADDVVIVDAVVGLANALGLACVAEGVEQPDQLEYLRSIGCSHVQGYLIARPMPVTDVAAWLRTAMPDALAACSSTP